MKRALALLLLAAASADDTASDGTTARVTYYVKHRPENVAALLRRFHEVSDPRHPDYGKHMSHEEVQALQEPKASHIEAVRTHIRQSGGTEVSATVAQDKIVAVMPVERVAALSKSTGSSLWDAIDTVAGLPRTKDSERR